MLKIHHLNFSRSERGIWLAEELGIPYELIHHTRDPQTMRSPQSLWAVHPMGKAPVIQDGDQTVFESGAVLEYILEKYGEGRLRPAASSPDYGSYLHWMHAAESTLMLPVMIDVLCTLSQSAAPGMNAFADGEYNTVFGYLDRTLTRADYVAGSTFTAADIMVTYVMHLANGTSIPAMKARVDLSRFLGITAYLARVEARPAYRRMRERA
jgi:glutathione S-transferase